MEFHFQFSIRNMAEVRSCNELTSCYAEDVSERFIALGKAFHKKYGQSPTLFTRAPGSINKQQFIDVFAAAGRVNLIGEHIDYEGYGVLPMAIKQDTIVAIAKGGDSLQLANLQSDLYKECTFTTDPAQEVQVGNHSWGNYFVCAFKGVYDLLASKGAKAPEPCGLQIMMHGTVPWGSGLSSSAAFVCSCFLAVLSIHGLSATQQEVAEFAARAERHVGVNGGGMDQAISVMGMQGVAKKIDFNPVRAQDVNLPPGAVFVIGNSLAVSNKAEGAHKRYNLRVVECRLAAGLLAQALGMPQSFCADVKTLHDLEPVVAEKTGKTGLPACAEAVEAHLKQDIYTHEEVQAALGVSLNKMFEGSNGALKAVEAAKEVGGFKLRQRALHVYKEAQRVLDFKAVCDSPANDIDTMTQLGQLMDDSHASCAQLYECSCPELEELVSKSKAAGALGARLTGAGWGGCTVSLVKEEDVDDFLKALKESFYASRVTGGQVTEADLGTVLFASKPSSGAAVLKLNVDSLQ